MVKRKQRLIDQLNRETRWERMYNPQLTLAEAADRVAELRGFRRQSNGEYRSGTSRYVIQYDGDFLGFC